MGKEIGENWDRIHIFSHFITGGIGCKIFGVGVEWISGSINADSDIRVKNSIEEKASMWFV
jgi:hypothetical protein